MSATAYARITRQVEAIVRDAGGNDHDQTRYMIMRAAALAMFSRRKAAERCYLLADELASPPEAVG